MIVQVKESRQGARTPYTWVAILQVRGRIKSCVSERPRLHMFWFELFIPASCQCVLPFLCLATAQRPQQPQERRKPRLDECGRAAAPGTGEWAHCIYVYVCTAHSSICL